ncbi:hypothetical protein BCT86_13730 [Vibrio breoganii]|nr:hypothetical protein BCT86_13730 [Vibrio breoganii]
MVSPETISIISAVIAVFSAIFAGWTIKEAKKGNDLARLNSLLSFRTHYLQLMEHQHTLAKSMPPKSSGMQSIRDIYADLDTKLREVNTQIELYHNKVVENKI